MRLVAIGSMLASLLLSGVAYAVPFEITAQLVGDPRPGNPDDIVIDVTITGDTDNNFVDWVVDLNSDPPHTNAFIGEFYFNVTGDPSDFSFSLIDPDDWTISTPASTVGGGNIVFLFEADDDQNNHEVDNDTNLTFRMTTSAGNFSPSDFLDAGTDCSNDATLGCGQLGAHVQGLTAGAGQSDSGFVLGSYQQTPTEDDGTGDLTDVPDGTDDLTDTPVSNPATLLLVGAGLVGLWGWGRRRG
jgi:hypothetical protein